MLLIQRSDNGDSEYDHVDYGDYNEDDNDDYHVFFHKFLYVIIFSRVSDEDGFVRLCTFFVNFLLDFFYDKILMMILMLIIMMVPL